MSLLRISTSRFLPNKWFTFPHIIREKHTIASVDPITPVRVRFAPSPTGFLHLGGLRTALFNYLLARKTGGQFLLRIEDTDKSRYVEGAIEKLIRSLSWAGITYDEGPGKDGGHGPYLQSQRTEIYQKYANGLLENGHAYRCFCTTERLSQVRTASQKSGFGATYDRHCFSLSQREINENLRQGVPFTIRLLTPDDTVIKMDDIVHGRVEFGSHVLSDPILLKSDGYPTYHLANVVDDYLMGITHVLRGEEWLPSTPTHLLLYKAFGLSAPQFGHLPLLLNNDRSKLSKRAGDAFLENYASAGYLPESLINFVALLGWNPGSGSDREFFTLQELEKEFSLTKLNRAAAIVGLEKLSWMNKHYLLQRTSSQEGMDSLIIMLRPLIVEKFGEQLKKLGEEDKIEKKYLSDVIDTIKDRIRTINDIPSICGYLFIFPDFDSEEAQKFRSKLDTDLLALIVRDSIVGLTKHQEFTSVSISTVVEEISKRANTHRNDVLMTLRYAVTGSKIGAGIVRMMEILGHNECLKRLRFIAEREGL